MRVVYLGTPGFAATILEALAEEHEVACAYTRPDAARSRGSGRDPSPVRAAAEARGIPVRTPNTLRDPAELDALAQLAPDAVCVAAYGMILPPAALSIPRYGCVNVHASLLPRWRGAAPIERAILAGDAETGVCVMRMEEGLDTGPYCVRRTVPVGEKSAAELSAELSAEGADALLEALRLVERGEARWTAQSEAGATYAAKVGKGELALDPATPAGVLARRVRASSESHPARCSIAGRPLAALAARPVSAADLAEAGLALAPGRAALFRKRLLLGTADGALEAVAVKPDGRRAMDGAAFAAGVQGIKRDGAEWGRADG